MCIRDSALGPFQSTNCWALKVERSSDGNVEFVIFLKAVLAPVHGARPHQHLQHGWDPRCFLIDSSEVGQYLSKLYR